jgi:hypothetical protein
VAASVSKLVFIGLVLTAEVPLLAHQAGVAVFVDGAMVLVFAGYLAGGRRSPSST